MQTAVVLPCLNEEAYLAETCLSLGFGGDASPPDTVLILVDNGSTDDTAAVMEIIKKNTPKTVLLGQTLDRGYVPPRHLGVLMAKSFADEHGVPNEDLLILQADADTVYDRTYIASMVSSALSTPQDLIEGVAQNSKTFLDDYPGYHACCAIADEAVSSLFVAESDEVIVDDKVAGYRLSEYLKWGGHQREFDAYGDEIHAETSRLFIRAKMHGAGRTRSPEAVAYPSRRKIRADPLGTFVTAGFPRESGWRERWVESHPVPLLLREFDCATIGEAAVFIRQIHTLILFALVPTHVQLALGQNPIMSLVGSPLAPLLSKVDVSVEILRKAPGRLFEAFFTLAEKEPELFADCVKKSECSVSPGVA
ncbi:glycosyltransferase family 2 protein [Mesorhizobium neociceri]|uniref:Glycosyltransferase n=1 Tax=Mesorhizobium neociceri TaxID=1307853 RepID=A0A838AYQ4_9HYPH|nr:glycosyltransferase [Mesorhizobium neociceri]MBA1138719.1 glycosyltransferase [Mesorhizobium neociceri]